MTRLALYHKCDTYPNDAAKLVLFDKSTNCAEYTVTVNGEPDKIVFPVYKSCCHFAKDEKFTKKVDLSKHYPILKFQ